ncbi:MAG: hypothetical protein RL106_1785 [Bacteroidota bacterium]|jgi:hypothetical protein
MTNKQYQSEDIETLLIQKEFSELLPEEKDFVLSHLESETEYTRMRNLLFQLIEMDSNDIPNGPDESVKKNLDTLFNDSSKKRTLWQSIPFWSISGIAAVFVIGFFYFRNPKPSIEHVAFADNNTKKETSTENPTKLENQSIKQPEIDQVQFVTPDIMQEIIQDEVSESEQIDNASVADVPLESAPSILEKSNFDQVNSNLSRTPVVANDAEQAYGRDETTTIHEESIDITQNYPGGTSALTTEIHQILKNNFLRRPETQEVKKPGSIPLTKVIFKISVDVNGNVSLVEVVKSSNKNPEQLNIWCESLKRNLKKFATKNTPSAQSFYFPVNLELH